MTPPVWLSVMLGSRLKRAMKSWVLRKTTIRKAGQTVLRMTAKTVCLCVSSVVFCVSSLGGKGSETP